MFYQTQTSPQSYIMSIIPKHSKAFTFLLPSSQLLGQLLTAGALGLETRCLHPRSVPVNHQERNPSLTVAWPSTFSNSKYFKMIQSTQLGCPTGTSEASANTCSEVVLGLLPFGHSLSSNMLTQQICSKGCSKVILEVTKSSICSLDSACMPPEMKVFCPFTTSASCDQWHVAMTNL